MKDNTPSSTERFQGGALHRSALAISVLVLLTCGYVRNTRPGWNVNTQFALTCAIVEHGTLNATVRTIDDPAWPGGGRITFDQMLAPGAAFDADSEDITLIA